MTYNHNEEKVNLLDQWSKSKLELEERSNDLREAYTQNVRQMVNDHSNELEHLKQIHSKEIEQLQIQFEERQIVHQQDMSNLINYQSVKDKETEEKISEAQKQHDEAMKQMASDHSAYNEEVANMQAHQMKVLEDL